MNWQQALDELRLRYSEELHQIETLERIGKRPAEEMALKRLRLERLKSIGLMVADIVKKDERVAA